MIKLHNFYTFWQAITNLLIYTIQAQITVFLSFPWLNNAKYVNIKKMYLAISLIGIELYDFLLV